MSINIRALKLLVFASFTFLVALGARAEEVVQDKEIDVWDTPTAYTVEHMGYDTKFMFGQEGSLDAKAVFGVFPRLNVGFSLDGENIIGTGPAKLNRPELNLKFRILDEKKILPTLAIGYDGQGYMFNEETDEYDQKQLGFYMVGTKELFVPGFIFNLGVNRYDFSTGDTTRGFTSAMYMYENLIGAGVELVSITDSQERRINYGIKYKITPVFAIDFYGRTYTNTDPTNSNQYETERVIRLDYRGAF